MECSRGYNVNVSLTIERRIMADSISPKAGMRFLHESVMSLDEIRTILHQEINLNDSGNGDCSAEPGKC
jgi:hypothetical protein